MLLGSVIKSASLLLVQWRLLFTFFLSVMWLPGKRTALILSRLPIFSILATTIC